jgi:hypothetical protein
MYQQPQPQSPPKSHAVRNIVIVVIVVAIVIIAIIGALAVLNTSAGSNLLHPGQATATVIVTVHSTHILNSINYDLTLNGVSKYTGSIAAGSSVTKTMTVTFPIDLSGSYDVVVSATSTGGGFGATTDSSTVTCSSGGTYPITLNI